MIRDARTTKALAKQSFEAWARSYDRSLLNYFLFRPSYYTFLEELAKWQEYGSRTFDVLDVGCGTGTFAGMIATSNLPARHVVGLDYAMEMCQQARVKTASRNLESHVQFLHGDSEHLPFADASFDIITCSNSFHHYPHQRAVVAEMHRLLSPQGRLIVIDGFRDCAIGWVVFDVIVNYLENQVYHAPWPIMDEHFAESGFRNIRRRKFNFLFPAFATIGDK